MRFGLVLALATLCATQVPSLSPCQLAASDNPFAVPARQTFNQTLDNAVKEGLVTMAEVDRICGLSLSAYSYYWAPVADPLQMQYVVDMADRLCLFAINQFVFLGDPSDDGEGAFTPKDFAEGFVVPLAKRGVTVNVFFDDTILPSDGTDGVCQRPCGGAASGVCPCNATASPASCMWLACDPEPQHLTNTPCCCGSIDLKMAWVVEVQNHLRSIDPSLTLQGVNIDVETVCDEFRPMLLAYMKNYMVEAGEVNITVGDTIGYEAGSYIFDRFGVPSHANTTALPTGVANIPPLSVLWIQNYNLVAEKPTDRGFEWYSRSYVDQIPPHAHSANLQIMATLNCCDGPCASPSCDSCGQCCNADTSCVAPARLPPSSPWGDPTTNGSFCPYHALRNGTAISFNTALRAFEGAYDLIHASPVYPTLRARNISVHFAAFGLRALHILMFGTDLTCSMCNNCKPHTFGTGGNAYDACGTTPCCTLDGAPTDDEAKLCPCSSSTAAPPVGWFGQT